MNEFQLFSTAAIYKKDNPGAKQEKKKKKWSSFQTNIGNVPVPSKKKIKKNERWFGGYTSRRLLAMARSLKLLHIHSQSVVHTTQKQTQDEIKKMDQPLTSQSMIPEQKNEHSTSWISASQTP